MHSFHKNTVHHFNTSTFEEIENQKDWYTVSVAQVVALGAGGLLSGHYKGSLIKALQTIYPEMSWRSYRFFRPLHTPKGVSTFSKAQYVLFQQLKQVSYMLMIE